MIYLKNKSEEMIKIHPSACSTLQKTCTKICTVVLEINSMVSQRALVSVCFPSEPTLWRPCCLVPLQHGRFNKVSYDEVRGCNEMARYAVHGRSIGYFG